MHEAGPGERVIERVAAFRLSEKMNHARRLLEGQSVQEQVIDQTEDRGVKPDPEGERDHCEQSEPRRLQQLAKSETKISHHRKRWG
jgi:hypothetical protein